MFNILGTSIGTSCSNTKYKDRDDITIIHFDEPANIAGVFTQSKTKAISIRHAIESLDKTGGKVQSILINAGNANCFTGETGAKNNHLLKQELADLTNCEPEYIINSSTGVIGEQLDIVPITEAIKTAYSNMRSNKSTWSHASQAILTTDTAEKNISKKVKIGSSEIIINGIAKGSGMIEPNMATMLCYVVTDANIPIPILKQLLTENTNSSFNIITVDGDCSTNDTVLLCATNSSSQPHPEITSINDPILQEFKHVLGEVFLDLAKKIVLDGEGATKFITTTVKGTKSHDDAVIIAKSIANSKLVQTALFASDLNWGRLIMAIGKTNIDFDPHKITLMVGDFIIAKDGMKCPDFIENDEVKTYMQQKEIGITVLLEEGESSACVYSCDLSHDYITINGSYRT